MSSQQRPASNGTPLARNPDRPVPVALQEEDGGIACSFGIVRRIDRAILVKRGRASGVIELKNTRSGCSYLNYCFGADPSRVPYAQRRRSWREIVRQLRVDLYR